MTPKQIYSFLLRKYSRKPCGPLIGFTVSGS
jgi:hypothetical protein